MNEPSIRTHISNFHEKNRDYENKVCQKKFARPEHLTKHYESSYHTKRQKMAENEKEKLSDSKLLERSSDSTNGEFSNHLENTFIKKEEIIVLDEENVSFGCDSCHADFESKEQLFEHIMLVHENKKQKPVKNIDLSNLDVNEKAPKNLKENKFENIDKNLSELNQEEESTICKICSTEFPTAKRLKKHISSVHEEKKFAHKCFVCNEKFSSNQSVEEHMTKVHEEKKFAHKCFICKEKLSSKQKVEDHIKLVHEEKKFAHKCFICNENFSSKQSVEEHMTKWENGVLKCWTKRQDHE